MCRHAKRLPVALLALLVPSPVVAFSVLSIEGGVAGGADLHIVGTDLGDPFNPPTAVDDASSVAFRGALSVSGASVLQADLAAPLPAPDAPPSSATSASTPLLNGSAAGGTLLHVQGNGFPTSTAAVSVELVDTADGATALTTCEVLASSASGLLCRTAAAADPDSAAGRVATLRLSVVDAGGGETAGTAEAPEVFSLLADSDVATISTVTPAAGSAAGGLVICIGGSRLLAGGTPTAMLGSTPCATVNATSAELCCRTSDHPTTGGVNLRVHDPLRGFARATTTLTFAYLTPPELASISPPAGHAGTVVTMSGSGLASAQLTLGGAPCTLTSYSDTEATCTAGDAAAGPATVELAVAGIGAARVAASVNFTYEIGFHSVGPAGLSAGGDAPVVIRGGGFSRLPSPVTVTLGSLPCAITSLTATEIACTSAPLFASRLNESALGGWSAASEAADVHVRGADTCISWSGATCASYRSAPAACTGPSCQLTYELSKTPLLMAASPSGGGVGTALTIHASGLSLTPALNSVIVGGSECAVQSAVAATGPPWDSEARSVVELVCSVSPQEAGEHVVRVGIAGHGYDIARRSYNFTHALKVLGMAPSSGSLAGGTTVSLSVDGFPPPEGVQFAEVMLGTIPCRLTFSNYTVATCVTAAAAAPGAVTLSATARGQDGSTAECPHGCEFTYEPTKTPTLTSASHTGTSVALGGTGFATSGGASAHAITVGGSACVATSHSTDGTSLSCVLPAPLAAGTHAVRLTRTDWGDAASAHSVHVTQALEVTAIAPAISSLGGGQLITISGSGFGRVEETSVLVCGDPCDVLSSSATAIVCATPAASGPETCHVDVSVAAQTESSACTAAELDVASEHVASTSCPFVDVEVIAGGAGARDEHTCQVRIGGEVLDLPATAAASFCAVRLRNASLTAAQVECFGADEYDAAASFLSFVNGADEGDLVLVSTCGASSAWRSTNMALQKPLITLGSALARQGSSSGGWWEPSRGAHAYAFIGRKSAGQIEAAVAEASGVRNASVAATIPCDAGGLQAVLAHERYGWGTPSHVSALAGSGQGQGSAPATDASLPSDVFLRLQALDIAATRTSNANAASTTVMRSAGGDQSAWLAALTREAVVAVDLGSVARVDSVDLSTSADSVLLTARDESTGEWRKVATAVLPSAPSVEFGPFGEYSLTLNFAAVAARHLKIHYASQSGIGVLAVRSLRVVGCKPAVVATLSNSVTYSAASTPQVLALAPAEGTAQGGTDVTVRGSGFGGKSVSAVTVLVAGVACPVKSYADAGDQQTVVCTTGAHAGIQSGMPWSGRVVLHVDALGTANASSATTFQYINLWSDAQTWGGFGLPVEGDTVFIPPGQSVVMDVSPPRLYFLVVQGNLTFARTNLQLDASFIFVMGGSFTVGTEDAPFLQEAQITLHGSPVSSELPLYGAKVIACRRCTLDLHGKPTAHTWTRLNQTAAAGATSMCFTDPVGWAAGSQLVVTSTGFDMNEAEQRTIAYLTDGGRCVSFDTPLGHEHLGETRHYAGVPVDLRAEVGLLSRNVVVQGNDMSPLDRHGGHIMLYSHEGLYRDNTLIGRFSGKRIAPPRLASCEELTHRMPACAVQTLSSATWARRSSLGATQSTSTCRAPSTRATSGAARSITPTIVQSLSTPSTGFVCRTTWLTTTWVRRANC